MGFPSARTVRISRETDSRRRATRSLNRARTGSTLSESNRAKASSPIDVADVVAEQALGRCADEDEPAVGADHSHHVELLLAQGVEPWLRRGLDPLAGQARSADWSRRAGPGTGPSVAGPPTARAPRTRRRRPAGGSRTWSCRRLRARSASHRGWKTCHCSGARRISPSNRVAISWVSRATSCRRDPCRVVSSGGSHDGTVVGARAAVDGPGHQAGADCAGPGWPGPAGMVVVSPKNSTSIPLPARSRSLNSPTRPPRRSVDMTDRPRLVQGDDGQSHGRPLLHEELEQLGRLDPLGHRGHRHALAWPETPRRTPSSRRAAAP